MKKSKIVTLWYRWDAQTNSFRYNHYSEGWDADAFPVPKSDEQAKSWISARWCKEKATLDNGHIIHLTPATD